MNHPQAPLMYEAGIRQLIAGPLTYGGEAIGMLCFNSNQEDFYTEQDLPMFEAIAEQLSVAVANVLANEEVLAEKAKVERLHFVSEVMSSIQHRHQLKYAFDRIRTVFPFDNAGLFVLTADEQEHYELLDNDILGGNETQAQIEARYGKYARYPHANSPIAHMMQRRVGLYGVVDLVIRFPDYPQSEMIQNSRLQQIIAARLQQGGQVIGLLNLNSNRADRFSEADFAFFQALAEQMSTVVSNVLANEREQEEKQFKETLLGISEAVASIQNRTNLFKTIFTKIKPVFSFDELGVFVNDETGQYQRDLSVDSEFSISNAFKNQVEGWMPHDPGINQFMQQGPMIRSLSQLMQQYPDHPHYPMLEAEGLIQIIAGPLKKGSHPFGMLCFWSKQPDLYSKKDFPLFQAIADQLAVALNNVLANESLLDKQREKSEQLALNQSLIKIKDFDALLLQISQTIYGRIDFDAFSLWIYDDRSVIHHFLLMRTPDGSFQDVTYSLSQKYPDTREDSFNELRQTSLAPRILTGKVFEKVLKTSRINQSRYQFVNARSVLEYPIELYEGCKMRIALSSARQDAYRLSDLKTFEHYLPPIALAIQNQIAFQKIKELKDKAEQEKESLTEEIQLNYNFEEIIGQSEVVKNILYQVGEVAQTDSTVLITGETGTGKELIARAIHGISDRKHHTLIKLNCAALPTQLLESELFGHEKGAFTGAITKRVGKFEIAHQSTIFLDEIGELPLDLQAKLLRVIQEKEFERIGSNRVISVDVRIIAATNRHLPEEIRQGRFRSDLYYRLNVYPIPMPALRERREDIPLLLKHFLKLKNKKLGKKIKGLDANTLAQMMTYDWPGNIRELEHVLERAMISSKQNILRVSLPKNGIAFSTDQNHSFKLQSYQDAERELIFNTLKHCDGRISGAGGAAEVLELPPSTLESKMRRLGIKRKHVLEELD